MCEGTATAKLIVQFCYSLVLGLILDLKHLLVTLVDDIYQEMNGGVRPY